MKNFIINTILIVVLVLTAAFMYGINQPETRWIRRTSKEVLQVIKLRTQFSDQNISATCKGILPGHYYEECYVPAEKKLLASQDLTVAGLTLKLAVALHVLVIDRQAAQTFSDESLLRKNHFHLLAAQINYRRELRTLPVGNGSALLDQIEYNLRSMAEQKITEHYKKSSAALEEKFKQISEEPHRVRYLELLAQYDSAFSTR